MYEEEEVRAATHAYFEGDELATNVFLTKYCLRNTSMFPVKKENQITPSIRIHHHRRV